MKKYISFLQNNKTIIIAVIILILWSFIGFPRTSAITILAGTGILWLKVFADCKGYKRLSNNLRIVALLFLIVFAVMSLAQNNIV